MAAARKKKTARTRTKKTNGPDAALPSPSPAPRPNAKSAPGSTPLSDDDAAALDSFCQAYDREAAAADPTPDPLDLASFTACHASLDLTVPVFLSAADLQRGTDVLVRFSRTVREDPLAPPTRQPASCLVTIPPDTSQNARVRVSGQGDVLAAKTGDLLVIVREKR
jgi:hypothetical protein